MRFDSFSAHLAIILSIRMIVVFLPKLLLNLL